jgi:brefeldin A-inhibited guanine nucleotide-exchange protein
MAESPEASHATSTLALDQDVPDKATENVGLGITTGPPTPPKDTVSPAGLSAAPAIETIIDQHDNSDAPPPPPKPQRATSGKPAVPAGAGISLGRGESKEDLQVVDLSRSSTPAVPEFKRPNPASASVSSLHSMTSSVQSPSRPQSTRPRQDEHSRRSSVVTNLSLSMQPGSSTSQTTRAGPQLSAVLITPPLKVLVASKEARKSPAFMAAAQRALDLCQPGEGGNAAYLHPREIFEPLRLAISNPQTTSVPTLITSLDLLSKLISHSFFSEPDGPPPGLSPLPDLITHTITMSYSENSPPQVALQVVKALMAIVLSTDKGMLVHQSSLLKAVRTVYNVFLLSNDATNQVVAQGGLTQMVHHVFGRVIRPAVSSASMRGRSSTMSENEARRQAEAEAAASEEAAAEDEAAKGAEETTADVVSGDTPGPSSTPKLTL